MQRTHLTLALVGILLSTAPTAFAQEDGIELIETSGGSRRTASGSAAVDTTRWYSYTCHYWATAPFNIGSAVAILTVNGFVVDIAYGGGGNEVYLAAYGEIQSSAYDQPVVCEGYSVFNYRRVTDAAPGLPIGESTGFDGWFENTRGNFYGQLFPANGPFAGNWVAERAGGGGWDSCYFDGSQYDWAGAITPHEWPVNSANSYGFDTIGWFPEAVSFYRAYGQAPCYNWVQQDMVYLAPGSQSHPAFEWPYKHNILSSGLTSNTVWTSRDDVSVERWWIW